MNPRTSTCRNRTVTRGAVATTCLVAAGIATALALARPSFATAAAAMNCPALPVMVVAREPEDRRAACVGAGRAIAFLAERGYIVSRPITIQVVDTIDPIQGAAALGYFHAGSEVMKVLARSALAIGTQKDTVLGLPADEDLYASVFAHEISHAVFHQNVGSQEPSLAAHEYFAYTVQIATLPEPLRKRVLARYPGAGFSHLGQVSEIYLGLDPQRFAVSAYLHFRDAADQDAVLRRLSTLPSSLEMY